MSGIIQYENALSSGTKDSFQQVFYNNKWVQIAMPNTEPFAFNLTKADIIGGTDNYYAQISDSIFTSVARPFFRFYYTGNTSSFSDEVDIVHDIYELSYEDYSNTSLSDVAKLNLVRNSLNEKVYSFSVNTSGFTDLGFTHDFQPPQFYKNLGDFKKTLFIDRGQYFIATSFKFNWEKTCPDGFPCDDYVYCDNEGQLISSNYESVQRLQTVPEEESITGNTPYSGMTVRGQYFTYFEIPNSPRIESPIDPIANTISPNFSFSNADDGDEAVLNVSYNIADTGFTETVHVYNFNSTQKSQEFPLLNDREFVFRIGNRKFIIDVFGIKRSVISYSQTLTGQTPDIINTTIIEAESDNPGLKEEPTPSVPPSVKLSQQEPIGPYSLSGTVTGSIVTGATLTLKYPSGFKSIQTSDNVGNYSFSGLNAGTYTLFTSYRGYRESVETISLAGNINFDYKIRLIWGNRWDTFGDIGDELIGEN